MTVANPFRVGGLLDRAVPWISAATATALAATVAVSGTERTFKVAAGLAAVVIVARCAYLVVWRRRLWRSAEGGGLRAER
ncbi:hypothetical protein [Streptomyces mangrovisoli]|uniref:Uncharacterized protein n=1 Tax=Streptomyces mangrovisoli TaxID=1428628 RepID=A0A1J4P3J8_9ACTN|nr:hypothetical protein [Streptomyces mangrovisoli]OIJ68030.1 hypothetical protein WN71_009475 [Streptomyces mangrovisoli]